MEKKLPFMDFWKRLKQLFKENKPIAEHHSDSPQSEAPLSVAPQMRHELIHRDESEQAFYRHWETSKNKQQTLQWIGDQFALYQQSPGATDPEIDFLMIPSVNGFVLHYSPKRWDADEFLSLFDYFHHKMKELGYRVQVSDTKTTKQGNRIEQQQRHYLKPPFSTAEEGQPIDQQYGNIMVTLCLVNEKFVNLKFSATHYNDRLYLPPRSFNELIQKVCG